MKKKQTKKAETTGKKGKLKPGYLRDFISGQPVKATPEEVDAVQVFSRRLVEDLRVPGCEGRRVKPRG